MMSKKYLSVMLAAVSGMGMLMSVGCGEAGKDRISAGFGNADAQCRMGQRYEHGNGVKKDPKQAVVLHNLDVYLGIKYFFPFIRFILSIDL